MPGPVPSPVTEMAPTVPTAGGNADPVSLYREEGIVLRTFRLGEADRIVTFMTRGRGKVRAVAKGVRRTHSKFGARLEPLSHVTMMCWQGRELDIVNQAEVLESFRTVREDLGRVAKAYTLLEVVDQLAQEGHANPRLYEMVLGALRVFEEQDAPLLVPAFLLKVLALEGSAPTVDVCVSCGADHRPRRLRPERGRRALPVVPARAVPCPPRPWSCCVASWAGDWPRRSGSRPGPWPMSSPTWPPRPPRSISTAGYAVSTPARRRSSGPEPGGDARPSACTSTCRSAPRVRLLRLRHLDRSRSPDGALRGGLHDRDRAGRRR
jgi:recombinational DNA repair protein (RecF pathway)